MCRAAVVFAVSLALAGLAAATGECRFVHETSEFASMTAQRSLDLGAHMADRDEHEPASARTDAPSAEHPTVGEYVVTVSSNVGSALLVSVQLGTNGQSYSLALATMNSATMLVPCQDGCPSCVQPTNCYSSRTYVPVTCSAPQGLSCSSSLCNTTRLCGLTGELYYNASSASDYTAAYVIDTGAFIAYRPSLALALLTSEAPGTPLRGNADGLLGLASSPSDFLTGLLTAGLVVNRFGLCLAPGQTSGFLTVGGPLLAIPDAEYTYESYGVPYFRLTLEALAVNNQSTPTSGTPLYVDVSTPFLRVPVTSFGELVALFAHEAQCDTTNPIPGLCAPANTAQSIWSTCLPLDAADRARYPQFALALTSVTLKFTSDDYLFVNAAGLTCIALVSNPVGLQSAYYLGTLVLSRYTLAVDRDTRRVGFALTGARCVSSMITLMYTTGSGQQGALATAASTPLTVHVYDLATSTPAVGVPITFTLTQGDARVKSPVVYTNASGFASTRIVYGKLALSSTVTASLDGALNSPIVFVVASYVPYDTTFRVGLISGVIFLVLSLVAVVHAHKLGAPLEGIMVYDTLSIDLQDRKPRVRSAIRSVVPDQVSASSVDAEPAAHAPVVVATGAHADAADSGTGTGLGIGVGIGSGSLPPSPVVVPTIAPPPIVSSRAEAFFQ